MRLITREDMNFHIPQNVDHTWAETTFFDFYVPEANIHCWVYLVFRAGVGAVLCDVGIIDRRNTSMLDALYIDAQNHLPLPERMDKFTLPNGFSLDATRGPRDYTVDYVGVGDTEFHIEAKGIMEPYDIHDPAIDPLADPDAANAVANSGFGSAYANHFDLTCRVTGTLKVRGKSYAVDSVSTMDHSWGPRDERLLNPMCWMNANFSDRHAMHAIFALDPFEDHGPQHSFKHGYVVKDGVLKGCVSGRLTVVREEHYVKELELEMTDKDGEVHRATGFARTWHSWFPYANSLTPMEMLEYRCGDAVGYGTLLEAWPLDRLTGRR